MVAAQICRRKKRLMLFTCMSRKLESRADRHHLIPSPQPHPEHGYPEMETSGTPLPIPMGIGQTIAHSLRNALGRTPGSYPRAMSSVPSVGPPNKPMQRTAFGRRKNAYRAL